MKGFHDLASNLAGIGQAAAAGQAMPAFAVVTSYDPDNFVAKVKLQPPPAEGDAVESGWLPIMCAQIGNGWGVYTPPAIGDQVFVAFSNGDYQTGCILGSVPNDEDKAPSVPSGEIWMVHSSGSFIKLTSDGEIHSKGEWLHDGDFKATGDIIDRSGTNTVTLYTLRTKYNAHFHTGVTTGAGVSGPTNSPAT